MLITFPPCKCNIRSPGQYSVSDEEDVLDRELDADAPRSTEVTLTDGIAGDILDFKTGTFLDNTEIRVS